MISNALIRERRLEDVTFLGFDVFGTVVDWRRGVARAFAPFLKNHGLAALDPLDVAVEWRALYQPCMEPVRLGAREWTRLSLLNRETLAQLLATHGLEARKVDPREFDELARAWERLDPWPDAVEGLSRLSTRYLVGTISNGDLQIMSQLARFGGLPWHVILGAEITRGYKPQPHVYIGSAQALGLAPYQAAMVASHNEDLAAAQQCGLRTIFTLRADEFGPHQDIDLAATGDWDIVADSLIHAAEQLGC
jgi:2-haloacid dehalogenase